MSEDEDDDHDGYLAALRADGWRPMNHPPLNAEVGAHIVRSFGEPSTILRERLSKYVHLDIYVIPPSGARRFTTYVTSGMSDLPMNAPDSAPNWTRLELLVALPGPPGSHDDWLYLLEEMKAVARLPHLTGEMVAYGHTVMTNETADPIGPDTRMGAFILSVPLVAPVVPIKQALEHRLSNGEILRVLALIPIHPDELAFKLQHDTSVLPDRLANAGVTELYEPARPSVIRPPKRKLDWKRMLGRPM